MADEPSAKHARVATDLALESKLDSSAAQPSNTALPQLRVVTSPAMVDGALRETVTIKGVLELKAPSLPDAYCAPRDVLFVLDVSGSMELGEKLVKLLRVVDWAVDAGVKTDRISLITFNDAYKCLSNFVACTDDGKRALKEALANITAAGGTDISKALRAACEVLRERKQRSVVTQVVLVSDGCDSDAKFELSNGILDVGALGAPLYSVGLGADHDAELLSGLSSAGCGAFCYAETAEDVPLTVGTQVGGVASAVAVRARLTLDAVHDDGTVMLLQETLQFVLADETLYFPFSAAVAPGVGRTLRATLTLCDVGDGTERVVAMEHSIVGGAMQAAAPADVLLIDAQGNRVAAAKAMKEATTLATQGSWTEAIDTLNRVEAFITGSVSANEPLCKDLLQSVEALVTKMQAQKNSRFNQGVFGFALAMSQSHAYQRATGALDHGSAAYITPAMRMASEAASQHF
jgi:hypothetical protein